MPPRSTIEAIKVHNSSVTFCIHLGSLRPCQTKVLLDQAVGGKDAFKDAAENTKKIDEKVMNAGEMFHAIVSSPRLMELDVEECRRDCLDVMLDPIFLGGAFTNLRLRRKHVIFDSIDCALEWYLLWSPGGRSKGRN